MSHAYARSSLGSKAYRETPFSKTLREFLAESRKSQTLYSNCEGDFERRVFEAGDKDKLTEFVYNTIYDEKTDAGVSAKEHVDSLTKKILKTSQSFGTGNEIHFVVIWVFYFDYDSQKQNDATPVFKIYKKKTGDDAVFMDDTLKIYKSWDNYLDTATFPQSFLCVPRGGKYILCIKEDLLDLEFMCPKRICHKKKSYKPFCVRVVKPCIQKIINCNSLKEKVKRYMLVLKNFCINNRRGIMLIVKTIILLGGIFYPVKDSIFLMLFNCVDNAKMLPTSCQPETGPLVDKSLSSCDRTQGKMAHLRQLLEKPRQSVLENLIHVCDLVESNCRSWEGIVKSEAPEYLKVLIFLIRASEVLRKALCQYRDNRDTAITGIPESKGNCIGTDLLEKVFRQYLDNRDTAITGIPESKGNCIGTDLADVPASRQTGNDKMIEHEVLDEAAMEGILNNLHLMETHSPTKLVNVLRESLGTRKPLSSLGDVGTLLHEEDGKVCIFMPQSLPDLYCKLQKLLTGQTFTLKFIDQYKIEITDCQNCYSGNLFSMKDYFTVGLFPEEKLLPETLEALGLSRAQMAQEH